MGNAQRRQRAGRRGGGAGVRIGPRSCGGRPGRLPSAEDAPAARAPRGCARHQRRVQCEPGLDGSRVRCAGGPGPRPPDGGGPRRDEGARSRIAPAAPGSRGEPRQAAGGLARRRGTGWPPDRGRRGGRGDAARGDHPPAVGGRRFRTRARADPPGRRRAGQGIQGARDGAHRRRDRRGAHLMEAAALAAALAAVLTLFLGRAAIPRLRALRAQQSIREDAPARHQAKAGTPTMGGIVILLAVVVATLIVLRRLPLGAAFALLVMLGYGFVGGLDDLLKIRRHQNLGLRARERLTVQILLATLVAVYLARRPELGTVLTLPRLGQWDLGWGYVIFAVLYIVGFANAVNLTDGLDGLAGGTV